MQVATGSELETVTSSVAGINLSEPSAVVATSGSTIPAPTAFTTASDLHSVPGVTTASTAAGDSSPVSPAGPSIPPPVAFTPTSLPPPKELPPNITSHMGPQTTPVPLTFPSAPVQPPLMPSSDVPSQIPPQNPVQMMGEAPLQPSPVPYSMNQVIPPSSLPQPSPLTMGAVPTVPVTAGVPQPLGHTDTSIPMTPLPAGIIPPMQPPHINPSYAAAIQPPVPPTFTGMQIPFFL